MLSRRKDSYVDAGADAGKGDVEGRCATKRAALARDGLPSYRGWPRAIESVRAVILAAEANCSGVACNSALSSAFSIAKVWKSSRALVAITVAPSRGLDVRLSILVA